ncbi:hypothetical protein [Nocardioides sp.]|uniref:hypothetical protein n=1 Tax=Nocardioides sp. TaxID=35761 RepID=UPI003563FB36
MSIQSWYGARAPRGSASPHPTTPRMSPSPAVTRRAVPTELHQDLAALTRVILGIVPTAAEDRSAAPVAAVESSPVPEVAPIAPVPAATATLGRALAAPSGSTLASVPARPAPAPAPVVTDDHERLRRVLAELSFLDD